MMRTTVSVMNRPTLIKLVILMCYICDLLALNALDTKLKMFDLNVKLEKVAISNTTHICRLSWHVGVKC